MKKTTLCYISVGDKLLMLHRTKKKNDENAEKYIGLGGHFLPGETPLQCVRREVSEESGLLPDDYAYRGVVHFSSDIYDDEEMHLFTASVPEAARFADCDEGDLCLISENDLLSLKMWEGDLIFLSLLFDGADFFDLSLVYRGEKLISAELNGQELDLSDLPRKYGSKKNT